MSQNDLSKILHLVRWKTYLKHNLVNYIKLGEMSVSHTDYSIPKGKATWVFQTHIRLELSEILSHTSMQSINYIRLDGYLKHNLFNYIRLDEINVSYTYQFFQLHYSRWHEYLKHNLFNCSRLDEMIRWPVWLSREWHLAARFFSS